jgi:exosome complex component RRP46
MALPTALHPLHRASGSATYTSPTSHLTILSAVNFPLEVPRRSDELPTSLLIEVNVRPHDGVGMVKERHLEELVRKTLQAVVLVEDYPRCLMQVGLQVLRAERATEEGNSVADGYLGVLCGLLNAASFGALDAAVGMREVFVAVLIGVGRSGEVVAEPGMKDRSTCKSMHLFCFGGKSGLLLSESEGRFNMEDWEKAHGLAQQVCLGAGSDVEMNGSSTGQTLLQGVRGRIEQRVGMDQRWRGG